MLTIANVRLSPRTVFLVLAAAVVALFAGSRFGAGAAAQMAIAGKEVVWRLNGADAGFSAVRLTDLYAGVSLKLHGSRARPEYDLTIAPGADASIIRLRFAGAQAVEVDSQGELSVRTPDGQLVRHVPVAFQAGAHGRNVPVSARFVQIAPDEVGFELGQYDASRELVIDPVYQYSSAASGSRQGRSTPRSNRATET